MSRFKKPQLIFNLVYWMRFLGTLFFLISTSFHLLLHTESSAAVIGPNFTSKLWFWRLMLLFGSHQRTYIQGWWLQSTLADLHWVAVKSITIWICEKKKIKRSGKKKDNRPTLPALNGQFYWTLLATQKYLHCQYFIFYMNLNTGV